ncbi:MAG: glycosyltransferase family 4 protein [Alicyclobacillus sp.]|nr:glycosyltransferase family 4 protein [Alicyclobacillus sp.]
MRVALVRNIASPYRIPVWSELATMVGEVRVFICQEREPNRIWEIPRTVGSCLQVEALPGLHLYVASRDWGIHWNPTIVRELKRFKPTHVVVTGYETPTFLLTIGYAARSRIPLVIWWGSHSKSSRSSSGPIASIRRLVLQRGDAFVTYGSLASRYLEAMGISKSRIVTGVNVVDPTPFADLNPGGGQQASIPRGRPVRFLYVGQLIARKGVEQLIRAFADLPAGTATLTIVGYGVLESQLRIQCAEMRLDHIHFAGPTRNAAETARFYQEADVIVMPSEIEVWGLVVNEALAAGVYVLSSKYAGVTPDLIEVAPYDVGMSFDPLDHASFVAALHAASEKVVSHQINRDLIQQWGLSFTPQRSAQAVCKALALASREGNVPFSTDDCS